MDSTSGLRKTALVIVDLQNDFASPTGALYVREGDRLIPIVNELRQRGAWDVIVLTQDWHPQGHVSFYSTHAERKGAKVLEPFQLPDGTTQILWPDHCIQRTKGAELHPDLVTAPTDWRIHKGTLQDVDSYSAFYDNKRKRQTELAGRLRAAGVTDVYLAGLALDYCVDASARDALAEGFRTFVVEDATRGLSPDACRATRDNLERLGVRFVASHVLLAEAAEDPRRQAELYLAKHNIHGLFERLCARLVEAQPDNPRAFLVEEIKKIQQERSAATSSAASILTDADLERKFALTDPLGKGYLTGKQVRSALTGRGAVSEFTVDDKEHVDVEKFKKIARLALGSVS